MHDVMKECWFDHGYSEDLRLEPRGASDDGVIPYDIYLLLTADFVYDPDLMNLFGSPFIKARSPEIELLRPAQIQYSKRV